MGDLIRAARPMQGHFLHLLECPDAKAHYEDGRSLFPLETMAVVSTILLAYDNKVTGEVRGTWFASLGLFFS